MNEAKVCYFIKYRLNVGNVVSDSRMDKLPIKLGEHTQLHTLINKLLAW